MLRLISDHNHQIAAWAGRFLLALVGCGVFAPWVAAELAEQYLAGLRERGWHDVALEYLDRAPHDPIATEEFLERVDYQRGTTLTALAEEAVSPSRRDALLEQAIAAYRAYISAHPESLLALDARSQMANLLAERGLRVLGQLESVPQTADAAGQQQQARQYFEAASEVLEELLDKSEAMVDALPNAVVLQTNPGSYPSRQELESKHAEARFFLAKVAFEKAKTFESNSPQQKNTLQQAASMFEKIRDDYSAQILGYYAALYAGRAYQEMESWEKALDLYQTIVNQPINVSQFRKLIARAYRRRSEILFVQQEHATAIEELESWLEESRIDEREQAEWLADAFQLARHYQAQAELTINGDSGEMRKQAETLLRQVARHSGEFQRQARLQLANHTTDGLAEVEADSFEEAFTAGREAVETMNSSKLAARLAKENNPPAVDRLTEQTEQHRQRAIQNLRLALKWGDPGEEAEQLNECRYLLCWLCWEGKNYPAAAVLGKYLARNFPDSKYAPTAAKIALAAYEQLLVEVPAEEKAFVNTELAGIAESIVSHWPESPEATTAVNLLMKIALQQDQVDEARGLLSRLPADNRARAELSLGTSLWSRYLELSSTEATGTNGSPGQLKAQAAEFLHSGYERIRTQDEVTPQEATGVLYLVQVLLEEGAHKQARQVLEDPQVGPLTLVENSAPAASRPEFIQEAYKAGLRTYASLEPPQLDQAAELMQRLEEFVESEGNRTELLSGIYLTLCLQQKQQIDSLLAEGETAKAKAVAVAVDRLLEKVVSQPANQNWKIHNWIAQTYLDMGEAFSGKDSEIYLTKANEQFHELLHRAEQDPAYAPTPTAILGVRKRLADVMRVRGEFKEAFEQYANILAEKPNVLDLQIAAATVLQEWGMAEEIPEKLNLAIRGALPQQNAKNRVWGWLHIAKLADHARQRASGELATKYEEYFFQARYNAALARFATAKMTSGDARADRLRTARSSVTSLQRLYPDMGGSQWQQKFSALLSSIESFN